MIQKVQNTIKPSEERLRASLAGQYQFSIENVVDEAWLKTKGFKRYFWLAFAVIEVIIISLVAVGMLTKIYILPVFQPMLDMILRIPYIIYEVITYFLLGPQEPSFMFLFILLMLILILPLFAGVQMMCIAYVCNKPYSFKMIFDYYQKPLRYWFAYLWIAILSLVTINFGMYLAEYFGKDVGLHQGFGVFSILFFLPLIGIICFYFIVSYSFVFILLADRKLRTWQALETSRLVVTQHILKISGFMLLIFLITILPQIAVHLLVALISPLFVFLNFIYLWITPFTFLTTAILYRDIFGVASLR